MFMAVTMESATFMGKNFQDNQNSIVNTADGQADGVPKAGLQQTAADSRGSRTCMCAITFSVRGGTREG